jgi:hypothetical protein
MALENRNGNLYYYRSVREGERVRKVYIGAGEFARISSERDVLNRTGREEERQRGRETVARLEALAAPLVELDETADALLRAAFVAGGHHRYKGEWRLRRG